MTHRVPLLSVALLLGSAALTAADPAWTMPEGGFVLDGGDVEEAAIARHPSWFARAASNESDASPLLASVATEQGEAPKPRPRPRAFEYSDGYQKRLKIHKYASYATIPLFAAQFAVGQKLYNGTGSDGTRSLHGVLAGATGALFAVNTVTGVWNLSESRKDPNNRTKRTIHGVLMLLADAGFVATGLMTPETDRGEGELFQEGGGTSASTHRAVALASMGVATVAYLMMLIH